MNSLLGRLHACGPGSCMPVGLLDCDIDSENAIANQANGKLRMHYIEICILKGTW